MPKSFLLIGGLAVLVILLSLATTSHDCRNFRQAKLAAPAAILQVAIATTPADQALGLAGCRALPKNSGMYFIFPAHSWPIFWMKDMVMPIDIVWIASGHVVAINDSVPPPPSTSVSDNKLTRY